MFLKYKSLVCINISKAKVLLKIGCGLASIRLAAEILFFGFFLFFLISYKPSPIIANKSFLFSYTFFNSLAHPSLPDNLRLFADNDSTCKNLLYLFFAASFLTTDRLNPEL
jgi:hypothetical protein